MSDVICVTGAGGFVGSWIFKDLIESGYKMIGIDRVISKYVKDYLPLKFDLIDYNIDKMWQPTNFKLMDLNWRESVKEFVEEYEPSIFVHLAANAREGASQFQPYSVTQDNFNAYINILEQCIKTGKLKKTILFSCHDKDTKLVTTEGIKNYKEIKPTDKVFTLNIQTQQVEIKCINEIIINQYTGPMLQFKGRANLCVTPNHRMLYIKSPKLNPRLEFELAEKTYQRAWFKLPQTNWTGYNFAEKYQLLDNPYKTRPQPTEILTNDLFYLIGLFIADGTADEFENKSYTKSGLSFKERQAGRDEFGRYTVCEKTPTIRTSIARRIRFSVPQNNKARRRLEETLNRNGFRYSKYKNEIQLFSFGLFKIFRECGAYAYDKTIPKWVLKANKTLLMNLWEGLMDGDGHKNMSIYTTVSEKLVRDCIELGIKINKTVSYKFHKPKKPAVLHNREIFGNGAYYIVFGKTEPNMWKRGFSTIEYNDNVWCLNVDNGNFLIERNGKICFSGNSMAVYGDQKPPFNEDMLPRPVDIYAINKASMEHATKILAEVHGFKYTIIRPHNIFGLGQSLCDKYRNAIGIFMNNIMRNEPITIYGDGEQKRAFSYIDDSRDCYLKTILNDFDKEVFNIGGIYPITINEVAQLVIEAMGHKSWTIRHIADRPCEVKYAWTTHEKSVKMLGYEERIGHKEGIKRMAEWAKKFGPQEWINEPLEIINDKTPETWRR